MIDTFKECSALDMAKAEQVWKIWTAYITESGEITVIECVKRNFNETCSMKFWDIYSLEHTYADDKTRKTKRVLWDGKPYILVMETLV